MGEKENFYDEQIAPELKRLAEECAERGLSFLAVAEWADNELGSTVSFAPGAGLAIRHAFARVQARDNFDAFCFAVIKEAHGKPHSSICLKLLGVPLFPEPSHDPS